MDAEQSVCPDECGRLPKVRFEEVKFICRHSAGAAKYRAVADAGERLGSISAIRSSFIEFQGYLYDKAA